MKSNSWMLKGILLGAVFFVAIYVVKPIGVSTQFSVLSGIIHSTIEPGVITKDDTRESGYKSTNAYYDKNDGKLAAHIKKPLNYDFIFVLAIPLGAYVARLLLGRKNRRNDDLLMDQQFLKKTGMENESDSLKKSDLVSEIPGVRLEVEETPSFFKRYVPSFIGGFLLLYGARMADGCTSGHMMSGMMQGAVSGYIFAGAVFVVAIPLAILLGMRNTGGRE